VPTYLKSIWFVLANFIFFLPRRTVTFEFVDLTQELKEIAARKDRLGFNERLEEYYNENGEEKVLFLRHYFYSPKLKRKLPEKIKGSVDAKHSGVSVRKIPIPKEILEKVQTVLAKELKIKEEEILLESNLAYDLNLDSLGLVKVIDTLEKEFPDTQTPDIHDINRVHDLCLMIMGKKKIVKEQKLPAAKLHLSSTDDYNVLPDPSKNVLTHFLEVFTKDGDEYFAWDAVSGTSQRKGFLLKAAVVSELIKHKVKSKHVGIMLPALQSTTLLIIATYMAGKIPVMFNWTVGQKVLKDCFDISKADAIITASTFYDRVKDQIPEEVASKLIFLDKEVNHLGLGAKLKGVLKAKLPKLMINDKKIDDTAVILFTSGSETKPKAVPLTHENVVTDLWGALNIIDIRANSVFLSFLPPFHSFGFTVLSILPLLTGVKVAYTPDPTKLDEVINVLRHTRATNVMVTPTFLKMMLSKANKYDLRTVELVISGAESLHAETKELFEQMTENRAIIIEGYGITECAPIVSLNPFDAQKLNSVGKFIKGLDFVFINPETDEPIPNGEEGMIAVSGKSIFKGYLDPNIPSPFIEIDGKKFYKTGDLGKMDEDGFVYITGRLKRFVKKGGEMVSMPLMEKLLLEKFGESERVVLAIEGEERDGVVKIVAFVVKGFAVQDLNKHLQACGLSALYKLSDLIEVPEIPLLGTGKTDYKQLKEQVKTLFDED
jgi:long-chain-fatty-acid--[acyl-carrier-protein] ligase